MQELEYHLQKEDYMDWIHWNVGRQNHRKTHIITLIIYLAFLVFYVGGNIAAKKPPTVILTSIILMVALGAFMFYTISAKHQEQVIWKRSGLKKLEKKDGFPTVHLTVREDGLTMEVKDQIHKDYSYADIKEIQEIDRLFLLAATSDGTWQFVAKSAFENENQISEFKRYMEEKIEDAKENPEKYRKIEEEPAAEAPMAVSYSSDRLEEDDEEVTITPVDTTNMGKIGKMAHIMAAMEERRAQEDEQETAAEPEILKEPDQAPETRIEIEREPETQREPETLKEPDQAPETKEER